jgi:predicted small metal-binding protein
MVGTKAQLVVMSSEGGNEMGWVIHCDCGTPVRGTTDDELVANAQDHAKNKHGVIVTREQALGLAKRD